MKKLKLFALIAAACLLTKAEADVTISQPVILSGSPGTAGQVIQSQGSTLAPIWGTASGGGAPSTATYITQTADGTLTNEQALSALATGLMKVTTTSGAVSSITDNSTNWNTAFTQMLQWDGGATNLVAVTGRTSLGATTVGGNVFMLTNPNAISFMKINADNTVVAESSAAYRTSIGASTAGGQLFTLANPASTSWLKISNVGTVTAEDAATTRTSLGATTIGTNLWTQANQGSGFWWLKVGGAGSVTQEDAATTLTSLGAQPVDGDLTAIAALSGLNTLYYRQTTNTWSPATFTAPVRFTAGTFDLNTGVDFAFSAQQTITYTDAQTALVAAPLVISHNTTAAPVAAGFGTTITMEAESGGVPDQVIGRWDSIWSTAGATPTSYLRFYAINAGALDAKMFMYGGGGVNFVNNVDPGAGVVYAGNYNVLTGYQRGGSEWPISTTSAYVKHSASANVYTGVTSIPNADLTNSSITIGNAGAIALGNSVAADAILTLNGQVGLIKRTATNTYSAATAGTDYQAPLNATIVKTLTSTTTATYTVPATARALWVECVGGGGGGGGALGTASATMSAGGGGGGGYAALYIGSPAASYSYKCGLGGAGGLATGVTGSTGVATTFGASLTANGGTGGAPGTAKTSIGVGGGGGGGVGGAGATLVIQSGDGASGIVFTATTGMSGQGGLAPRFGGNTIGKAAQGAGLAGAAYGGGGSGALSVNTTGTVGGDGANGIIQVTEFY